MTMLVGLCVSMMAMAAVRGAILQKQSAQEWGQWSRCLDQCDGNGPQQSRTRECPQGKLCGDTSQHSTAQPISPRDEYSVYGDTSEDSACVCPKFDPQVDCYQCTMETSSSGFVGDCFNCKVFHHCEWLGDKWVSYPKACSPCTKWSQDALTCVNHEEDPTCPGNFTEEVTAAAVTYIDRITCARDGQVFQVDKDPEYYLVKNHGLYVRMPCAPSTAFDFIACECLASDGLVTKPAQVLESAVCIDFDEAFGKWGFNSPEGVWVENHGVALEASDCVRGHCGYFDGKALLQVRRFINAYSSFKQFSVSLWYKVAADWSGGEQGLLSNGNCISGSSVLVELSGPEVETHFITNGGSVEHSWDKGTAGEWHHLALSYDGSSLTMYQDGNEVHHRGMTGAMKERDCALSFGYYFNNRYFKGHMDEMCIYGSALSASDVKDLFSVATDTAPRG